MQAPIFIADDVKLGVAVAVGDADIMSQALPSRFRGSGES